MGWVSSGQVFFGGGVWLLVGGTGVSFLKTMGSGYERVAAPSPYLTSLIKIILTKAPLYGDASVLDTIYYLLCLYEIIVIKYTFDDSKEFAYSKEFLLTLILSLI